MKSIYMDKPPSVIINTMPTTIALLPNYITNIVLKSLTKIHPVNNQDYISS